MREVISEEDLKKYEQEVREEIQKISVKDLDHTLKRLKTLILYSIERIDYYEDYRHRYLTISTTLIAFSITLIAFIYKEVGLQNVRAITGFIIGAIVLAIFCFVNILSYLYNSIYPKYPHRPLAKSSWFYRYNLSIDDDAGIYMGPKNTQSKKWLNDLKNNVIKHSEITMENTFLEDSEQLIILHAITAYKQKFARTMQNILTIGILLFTVICIITIFVVSWPSILAFIDC